MIAKKEPKSHPKTYRITRFRSIRLLDASVDVPEDFDLEDYFGNAWSVFRGDERFDIELYFTADAAELVAETNWHKTQDVTKHDDGSATLTFSVDGLDEIVWWVLGWSARVTVRKPEVLRQRVVEEPLQSLA